MDSTLPPLCPKCGAECGVAALGGLCALCLFTEGLEAKPVGPHDTTRITDPNGIRRLGDYELIHEVARGGMGIVYRARQLSLGRIVAVKVLSGGEFASKEYVKRFRAESAAAARLQHGNIVAIHEVGEQDGVHFFSMEFVEGPNLSELVRRGPLSAERSARYLKSLAEAVQYAHLKGILHRDLKPSNILIDPFDQPRITDFGLAKELSGKSDLTEAGQVLGTPGYMPPEQAASKTEAIGPASDVYSLGAILYFLLAGRAPFAAGSLHETLAQVLHSEPVSPRMLNPAVPQDLETICLKCLEKDPSRRYASASDLMWELDRYLAGQAIRARPISLPELVWRWCHRQPALATLIGLVLVLLTAIAFGSSITAFRIAAARDAETREREHSERTVNQLEMQRAEDLLGSDRVSPALARLANVLRKEPTNEVAAARIVSLLMQRSFPMPVFKPVTHGGNVQMAAFSPDGRMIATAASDGVARIWDAVTGHPDSAPLVHGAGVKYVGFSPDGSRLYTTSSDTTARIWNVQTGRELVPALEHESEVRRAALSADGRRFVTVTAAHLRMWDAQSGQLLHLPINHGGNDVCLDLSDDGALVVAGGFSHSAKVWELKTAKLVAEFPGEPWVVAVAFNRHADAIAVADYSGDVAVYEFPSGRKLCAMNHHEPVESVAFSPDGQRLVTASRDCAARVWDARTGQLLLDPLMHRTVVGHAQFSPDGRLLLTTCWDSTAWIWDATCGRLFSEPIQHDNRILTASFSPDGRQVITGSADRTTTVWDIRPGQQQPLSFRNKARTGVGYNRDGTRLVVWSQDGTARVWNPINGEPVSPLLHHNGWILGANFSPDGSRVVTASMDATASVWDSTSGKKIVTIRDHANVVEYSEFSPDGRFIVTASRDGTAGVWNAATGQRRGAWIRHQSRIWSARFSPDGRWLVTASDDGTARVWNAATGAPVSAPMKHELQVFTACFSPDSRRVVTGSFDMSSRVWDAETGHPLSRPLKHQGGIRSVEFSPDGSTVVTASGDTTARLWEVETGRPRGEPMGKSGEVYRATFSGDGSLIATCSREGTARVWSGVTGQPLTEPLAHSDWMWRVAISPNQRWLAAGQYSGDAFIWEVPELGSQPPDWLPALAEAAGGQRVTEDGFEYVSPASLVDIRGHHWRGRGRDPWERFARWFFADRGTRTISPSSTVTIPDYVDRLLREDTFDSLRCARNLDPERDSVRIKLAHLVVDEGDGHGSNPGTNADPFRQWVLSQPESVWARAEGIASSNPRLALEMMCQAEPGLPNSGVFQVVKGQIASHANLLEVAETAFDTAVKLAPEKKHVLSGVAALGRRNMLLRLNQPDGAASDPRLPLRIPGRDPRAGENQLDLTAFFNASFDEPWSDFTRGGDTLANLPRGLVQLGGVVYDLRGIVQLAGHYFEYGAPGYPPSVEGISVARPCRRLCFLHAASPGDSGPTGAIIGRYQIRYLDGTTESIPIVNREDLSGWTHGSTAGKPIPNLKRATIVWQGLTPKGTEACLFQRIWENPHPDKPIRSLDFISAGLKAGPFLLAITAE